VVLFEFEKGIAVVEVVVFVVEDFVAIFVEKGVERGFAVARVRFEIGFGIGTEVFALVVNVGFVVGIED
jgi:hypothetical protein